MRIIGAMSKTNKWTKPPAHILTSPAMIWPTWRSLYWNKWRSTQTYTEKKEKNFLLESLIPWMKAWTGRYERDKEGGGLSILLLTVCYSQIYRIHYKKMVLQYTTLKYITLQILHYTTLYCPTVHYTTNRPFSVFKSDNRVCYNILHYILITTPLKTLDVHVHYTTLHYTTLLFITLPTQ